jgi:hypothetical protein
MSIDCNFEKVCSSDDEKDDICGSVDLKFSYDNLATVSSDVCVDYSGDAHPATCFSYNIPLGDRSAQECSATYGGEDCLCEIDQNTLCINVNCSMYEASAVTDTCQSLTVESSDASAFLPKFAAPEVLDTGSENVAPGENGGVGKVYNPDDVTILEDDPNGALKGTGSSSASAVGVSSLTILTSAIFYMLASM